MRGGVRWSQRRAAGRPTGGTVGASPRGSLSLLRASQALAALRDRDYVLPDDVKSLAVPVLAHRLILKEEERLRDQGQDPLLEEIVRQIAVPAPAV